MSEEMPERPTNTPRLVHQAFRSIRKQGARSMKYVPSTTTSWQSYFSLRCRMYSSLVGSLWGKTRRSAPDCAQPVVML